MPTPGANAGLDFEALRRAIERRDLDALLGFYAEDAALSVVNEGVPRRSPFELRGRGEISKYLRAAFVEGTAHRVEREVVGEDVVAYAEACEYPDGDGVVVETTLRLQNGKIFRQLDVVSAARTRRKSKDDPPIREREQDGHARHTPGRGLPGGMGMSPQVAARPETPGDSNPPSPQAFPGAFHLTGVSWVAEPAPGERGKGVAA